MAKLSLRKVGKWVAGRKIDKANLHTAGKNLKTLAENPLVLAALGAATGGAAIPALVGAAAQYKGKKTRLGEVARGGVTGLASGGAGAGARSLLARAASSGGAGAATDPLTKLAGGKIPGINVIDSAIRDPGAMVGGSAGVSGLANAARGGAGWGDRLRPIGSFLGKHKDSILDYGGAVENIYENRRRRGLQDRYRNLAEAEFARRAPLRNAGQALVLDDTQPDVSDIFADPYAPDGRYRRVL